MKKYIPSLNGLRALSILVVILVHLNIRNFHERYWFPLIFDAELGVNIFFVLSGFLITTLLLQEEAAKSTVSLKDFYLRRFFRIFPVYYTLLAVYFILQLCGILHFSTNSWITSLTYTKYFNWHNDWETGHLWSLSVEEHFYLIWPFIFKYFRRYRVPFAWVIIVAAPVFRMIYIKYPLHYIDNLTIFQKGDALMWGCLFAIYKETLTERLKKIKFIFFYILLVFLLLEYTAKLPLTAFLKTALIAPLGRTTGTLGDMLVGILILSSISRPQTGWFRLLNTKALNFTGKLSYSLYIWQQLFFSQDLHAAGRFPLNILLIVSVALTSYYIVEQPCLRLKEKFHGRIPRKRPQQNTPSEQAPAPVINSTYGK